MKKKTLISAAVVCLMAGFLLTGCGPDKNKGMTDPEAEVIEFNPAIAGTWVSPGRDFSMEFREDGTFTDYEKLSETEGTCEFMSQNKAFVIADQFDQVDFISCKDEKDKPFYTGALLGDLLSGYNEVQNRERYYIRKGREEVTQDMLIGDWQDVNSKDYHAAFAEDGTLVTTDWKGTYELSQNEEYGTTVTFHFEKYDEEYAVVKYEKFLFLYRVGTSAIYQLHLKEE